MTLKPCSSGTWVKPTSIKDTRAAPWRIGQDSQASQPRGRRRHVLLQVLRCGAGIYAVMSGLADVVMVGGVEKMTHRTTAEVTEYLAMASDYPFEQWHGITFPGLFALMATAHMHAYGTTQEQIGLVAVKNHYHGSLNPKAHMQKEITLETVMASRYVAWPLKLYDCSLITDGASCIILTKPELAAKYTDHARAHRRQRTSQRHHRPLRTQKPHIAKRYKTCGENSLRNGANSTPNKSTWRKCMIASRSPNSWHTKTSASASQAKAANSLKAAKHGSAGAFQLTQAAA